MFPVGLYLLALVGGAVISAASLPLWRRWCEHVGLLDEPGHRKIHKHPVPLAGGLAVVTGLAVPILAAGQWHGMVVYFSMARCVQQSDMFAPTSPHR